MEGPARPRRGQDRPPPTIPTEPAELDAPQPAKVPPVNPPANPPPQHRPDPPPPALELAALKLRAKKVLPKAGGIPARSRLSSDRAWGTDRLLQHGLELIQELERAGLLHNKDRGL